MKDIQGLWPGIFLVFLACFPINSQAQTCEEESCFCDQNPAPAGIMVSHLHKKNQWMVSYRLMHMKMGSSLQGDKSVEDSKVLSSYLMTGKSMQMDMHMLMAMYGISDRLTVMTMVNFSRQQMEMSGLSGSGMGTHHHSSTETGHMGTQTQGLADTKVSFLYGLLSDGKHSLIFQAGLSLPTGSVRLKDGADGMYSGGLLPYCMQPGSGTWDLLPGISYGYSNGSFSVGSQLMAVVRSGDNGLGYRLGNEVTLNQWAAWTWNSHLSSSFRIEGISSGKIRGRTGSLDPVMEPSADPANYGGFRLNGFAGVNYFFSPAFFPDQNLGLEAGFPFYQNLNGIQNRNRFGLFASWSVLF
jgi:hypothetical protein